jgi:hypothetical protein
MICYFFMMRFSRWFYSINILCGEICGSLLVVYALLLDLVGFLGLLVLLALQHELEALTCLLLALND